MAPAGILVRGGATGAKSTPSLSSPSLTLFPLPLSSFLSRLCCSLHSAVPSPLRSSPLNTDGAWGSAVLFFSRLKQRFWFFLCEPKCCNWSESILYIFYGGQVPLLPTPAGAHAVGNPCITVLRYCIYEASRHSTHITCPQLKRWNKWPALSLPLRPVTSLLVTGRGSFSQILDLFQGLKIGVPHWLSRETSILK